MAESSTLAAEPARAEETGVTDGPRGPGSGHCRGITMARKAAAGRAPPSYQAIAARIELGSFSKPLPADGAAASRLIHSMLDMAMQADASALDRMPRVLTAFGEMPVRLLDRCRLLESLAADPEGRNGDNRRLLLSAVVLHAHLELVDVIWRKRLYDIWKALRKAEAMAADHLSFHLTRNLALAREARRRYLYPKRGMWVPRLSHPDYQDLRRAIGRVAQARKREGFGTLEFDQNIRTALTMASTVAAVWSSWSRGELLLDKEAWNAIAEANRLQELKDREVAEATYRYLEVLRSEAARHPILLLIHEDLLASHLDVARAIGERSEAAEAAIARIRAAGVNREVIPGIRRPEDVSCTGLARRLLESPLESVWKLPFFMERAILRLHPAEALDVRGIMDLAARNKGGEAIAQSLAFFGIETAALFAPAAGPVGIGLALAWALYNLGRSVEEYRALSALYNATLDPSLLLRGSEHAEPGKLGILLDLLGLLVWRK
jgi:hypothetical protein